MRIPVSILLLTLVLAEIATFIWVGEAVGVGATLALTLLAVIAGFVLLRRQGAMTLARMQADLAAGRLPGRPLFDGALVTLAALLMILPGFLSDLVGLALFLPPLRDAIWKRVARSVEVRRAAPRPAGLVIELEEGEYSRPRPDSPWRQGG